MLNELIKYFVKLLIIVSIVTECMLMLRPEKSLNDEKSISVANEKIPSSSKIGNVQKRNFQHATQTFSTRNNRRSTNEKLVREMKFLKRDKKRRSDKQGPKVWDQWGKWSGCSVTCGVGKLTRWRHCTGGSCLSGEKQAQLRTCTLSAC